MFEKSVWYPDYFRVSDDDYFNFFHFLATYISNHSFRYIYYLRLAQSSNNRLIIFICKIKLHFLRNKFGIEIPLSAKVGQGFLMGHAFNITIAAKSVIGRNVTMMKGSTIGMSVGKNTGVPTIGNKVYIGLNSTIIGNVIIGDNVMIAPNTFVNCDVPSDSIVIGNPCKIIPRKNPTASYIFHYLEN